MISQPPRFTTQVRLTFQVLSRRTKGDLCTAIMGSCSIIRRNPYPRSFFVMQLITNSWASALTRKVMNMATGGEKYALDEK